MLNPKNKFVAEKKAVVDNELGQKWVDQVKALPRLITPAIKWRSQK